VSDLPDPAGEPQAGSVRVKAELERERVAEAALEAAAQRHRHSLAGRLDRLRRWLGNRQTGPLPRLGRVRHVIVAALRDPSALPDLPRELARAVQRPRGLDVSPARPAAPPSYEAERAAAARRLRRPSVDAATPAPAPFEAGRPRIALIADPPLASALGALAEVAQVRPDDWRRELEAWQPELLLVEAAEWGNQGAWQYRLGWEAHPDALLLADLKALLVWTAEHDVPSVFWDTAEPSDSRRFRPAAALFDLLLVADERQAAAARAWPERRGAAVEVLPRAGEAELVTSLPRITASVGRGVDRPLEATLRT